MSRDKIKKDKKKTPNMLDLTIHPGNNKTEERKKQLNEKRKEKREKREEG